MRYEIRSLPVGFTINDHGGLFLFAVFDLIENEPLIYTQTTHDAALFIAAKQKEEAALKVVNEYEETA